jgi:hypothetical protein
VSPQESKTVIERLRAANPIGGVGGETPEQVTSFLLEVMERTDMVQNITSEKRESRSASSGNVPGWIVAVAGFALVVAAAVPMLLSGNIDPAVADLSPEHAALVTDTVAAINDEDLDAFASHFGPEGGVSFLVGIHRPYHEGTDRTIPTADTAGFEADFAWGAAIDRRVELRACEAQSDRIIRCEIGFSMKALRTGWVESLSVVLDESGQIALLSTEMLRPDPGPDDAPQELDFYGFQEFEDWLEETRPDEYERLIQPGTPGTVAGVEIQFSVPPRNPELVADMAELIDEYIRTR